LLVQTDYVITKLSDLKTQLELGLITQSVYEAETQKYQPIMQKRRKIREWNASMEARIQNASSLDELKQIEEEINDYQG
ncbi:MAG: hypothetical protein ACP5H3_03875, partial [Candidatus Aenigmatarchaeota archaeon]